MNVRCGVRQGGVRRFGTAWFLSTVAAVSGCSRKIPDAEWHIWWKSNEEGAVADVQTHRGHTCQECAADDEHAQALLHHSKVAFCKKHCGDAKDVECRLACDAALELQDRYCVDQTGTKSRSWLMFRM